MPECPDCEHKFTGKTCPRCGWERAAGPVGGPVRDPAKEWKTECEWTTQGRRCLIRPSAQLDGSRQYCSWHHAVALMGSPRIADHFDSYEAFVKELEAKSVCVMESHYPALVTFSWVCGERTRAHVPEPCRAAACSVRIRQEQREAVTPYSAQEHKAAADSVQQILAGSGSAPSRAGIPEIDPSIREHTAREYREAVARKLGR